MANLTPEALQVAFEEMYASEGLFDILGEAQLIGYLDSDVIAEWLAALRERIELEDIGRELADFLVKAYVDYIAGIDENKLVVNDLRANQQWIGASLIAISRLGPSTTDDTVD